MSVSINNSGGHANPQKVCDENYIGKKEKTMHAKEFMHGRKEFILVLHKIIATCSAFR